MFCKYFVVFYMIYNDLMKYLKDIRIFAYIYKTSISISDKIIVIYYWVIDHKI